MTDLDQNNSKVRLAGCLIFDDLGRLLLLHRNTPDKVQWETPGGKIETDDKSAEAAAKRELLEELKIDVGIEKLVGSKSFTENGIKFEYGWFLAKIISGGPTIDESKFDQFKYWSWEELNETIEPMSLNLVNILEAKNLGKLNIF